MNSATVSPRRAARLFSLAKASGPCIPRRHFAASGTTKCAGHEQCDCAGHCLKRDCFLRRDCLGLLAALVAPVKWISGAYLLAYLVLRFAVAWTVGVWGVGDELLRRRFWLVPL